MTKYLRKEVSNKLLLLLSTVWQQRKIQMGRKEGSDYVTREAKERSWHAGKYTPGALMSDKVVPPKVAFVFVHQKCVCRLHSAFCGACPAVLLQLQFCCCAAFIVVVLFCFCLLKPSVIWAECGLADVVRIDLCSALPVFMSITILAYSTLIVYGKWLACSVCSFLAHF